MEDFQLQSIFGGTDNASQLLPGEWDPSGQDTSNISAIIADGIRGTVNKLINTAVGEKFESGQLTATTTATKPPGPNLMNLLLVGAVIYFLVNSK